MEDRVFELYRQAIHSLNDKETKIFDLGFNLGISEGTARCLAKLNEISAKREN